MHGGCAQYGMHEGTSQSAGYVAGAAALLLAAHRAAGHNASGADMKDPLMRGVLRSNDLQEKCGAGARTCTHAQPPCLHPYLRICAQKFLCAA